MCVREIRVLDSRAAKMQDFPVVTTDLKDEWGADFDEWNFRWEIELSADFDERNFRWEIELVAMDAEGEEVGLLESDALVEDLSAALDVKISVYLNRLMPLGSMLGFPLS